MEHLVLPMCVLPALYSVAWIGLLGLLGPSRAVMKVVAIMSAIAFSLMGASIVLLWVVPQTGVLSLPSDTGTEAITATVIVAGNGLLGSAVALALLATTAAMRGQRLGYSTLVTPPTNAATTEQQVTHARIRPEGLPPAARQ
jgi:hypothetical protein